MKKEAIQWESHIDGENYAFSYEKTKRKHILTVNGSPIEIKGGFISTVLDFDEKFVFDGRMRG